MKKLRILLTLSILICLICNANANINELTNTAENNTLAFNTNAKPFVAISFIYRCQCINQYVHYSLNILIFFVFKLQRSIFLMQKCYAVGIKAK